MNAGHYFTEQPNTPSDRSSIRVEVGDLSYSLTTDRGVFSRDRLDPGTAVLLREMPLPDAGAKVLDLGCGYGPIACSLALLRPGLRIVGVDVNERAVELLRHNASQLGLSTVDAVLPHEVDADSRFDYLYSNPPIRIGKEALHSLLLTWLPRLTPDGIAYLVVQRNLGADSLARWLGEQGYDVDRIASHRGFRVLAVRRANS